MRVGDVHFPRWMENVHVTGCVVRVCGEGEEVCGEGEEVCVCGGGGKRFCGEGGR